jgi:hypothetical protein
MTFNSLVVINLSAIKTELLQELLQSTIGKVVVENRNPLTEVAFGVVSTSSVSPVHDGVDYVSCPTLKKFAKGTCHQKQ